MEVHEGLRNNLTHWLISTQTDKADGQYKKTASNEKLAGLRPDFQFTPMAEGLKKACDWFCENYETCRK